MTPPPATDTTAAPPDQDGIHPAVRGLQDFPDRLSPIVTKELRQGLRQPAFIILFLILQGLLGLVVVFAAVFSPSNAGADQGGGEAVSAFLFSLFGIAVLLVQPLRGLNALATELRSGTIDLLLLTRLDSWRITFGKWFAIVSQSALLLVAIAPYFIFRYFLGGMQLFSELLLLFTLFFLSAGLTGVTVGFSATKSVVIRGIIGVVMILAVFMLPNVLAFAFAMRGGPSPFDIDMSAPGFFRVYAGFLLFVGFIGYYFLEIAATQISPPAENRTTRKRVIAMAGLASMAWLFAESEAWLTTSLMVTVGLLIVDALTEDATIARNVVLPFTRRGIPGRLASFFLLPGWPSGTWYAGLVIIAAAASCAFFAFPYPEPEIAALLGLWFYALVQPALLTRLFFRNPGTRFPQYILLFLGNAVVGLVLLILGAAVDIEDGVVWAFPLFPPIGLMGFEEINNESEGALIVALVFLISCLLILAVWGLAWFRQQGILPVKRTAQPPVGPQPAGQT